MDRRALLVSLGALTGLAGCRSGQREVEPTATPTPTGTPSPTPASRLSMREPYRNYGDVHVTVDRVEQLQSVSWDVESTSEPQTGTPPEGEAYAFVRVRSENEGDAKNEAPWFDDFHVSDEEGGGTTEPTVRLPDVEGETRGYFLAHDITDPDREWYHRVEKTLEPGGLVVGWVPFVVDSGATLRVGLTHDLGDEGSHTVRWRRE